MNRSQQTIGLIVFLLVGACLLWFLLQNNTSDSDPKGQIPAIVATSSPTTLENQNTSVGISTSTSSSSSASVSANVQTTSSNTSPASMRYEVVTTSAAQQQGLGGRSSIPDNYGMLFVFSTDNTYGFWMKDMLVPIDMIWLSDNGTIVKIDASVPVNSYPNVFYPPQPVKYVLETKAGFASEHHWVVGTHVALPLPYGK